MTTYHVGPSQSLTSIDQVPWENLGPGDVVFIDYKPQPYNSKIAINAYGTQANPVQITGILGPNGEKPTIDANGATTRSTMSFGRDSASEVNQCRSLVCIVTKGPDSGVQQPTWIQISNLKFVHCHPSYTFHDAAGATQTYVQFGAAIWIDAGWNISITNCDFDTNTQAIFSKSIDGTDATITKNISIRGCKFTNNGFTGVGTIHTMYLQSDGVLLEGCQLVSMCANAGGNAVKSRSIHEVFRYNEINCGTRAFDLVEPEDWEDYAHAHDDHQVRIYGNIIDKPGQLCIHYGYDNDSNNDRSGTLWFWNNTVLLGGTPGEGGAYMFQISSTADTVQAFNNILGYASSVQYKCLRAGQDGPNPGGILDLGVNWINTGWMDGDPYHPPGGQLNGTQNLITGDVPPFDQHYIPNGAALNKAQAGVPNYPVDTELNTQTFGLQARTDANDLGAENDVNGQQPPPPPVYKILATQGHLQHQFNGTDPVTISLVTTGAPSGTPGVVPTLKQHWHTQQASSSFDFPNAAALILSVTK